MVKNAKNQTNNQQLIQFPKIQTYNIYIMTKIIH